MSLFKTIGLSYTRTCPIACRHCLTESSPRAKGRMVQAQARRYIEALSRFTRSTCFTGGEPLLFHRDIVELTGFAKDLDLKVSLVTGAGWVTDEATTKRRVEELAAAGLDKMMISWDSYHEEFLERERPLMLARSALEAGLAVTIRTVRSAGEDPGGRQAAFRDLPVEFEVGRILKLGFARNLPDEEFSWCDSPPKGACGLVLSPVIEPDGWVYACCGPSLGSRKSSPLVLGNAEAEPLGDILERAARDPILEVISLLGPYGLSLLLKDHPAGSNLSKARDRYSGICDLCLDITDSPDSVAAIRERIGEPDFQALLAAKRGVIERLESEKAKALR